MNNGKTHIILASLIKAIVLLPLLIINSIWAMCKGSGEFDKYCHGLAIGEDVYGGLLGKYTWDWLFLKKTAKVKYGDAFEINGKKYYPTISRITADNYEAGELNNIGPLFTDVLISAHDKAFNN